VSHLPALRMVEMQLNQAACRSVTFSSRPVFGRPAFVRSIREPPLLTARPRAHLSPVMGTGRGGPGANL